MQPAIYPNLSNDEYHADSAISRSGIMRFRRSPRHFHAEIFKSNTVKSEPTPAMVFGSAFHTFVLEPDKFYDEYAFKPEPVLLKDVGRVAYDEYKAQLYQLELSKKKVISGADHSLLLEMTLYLSNHEHASQLLRGAVYEQSYFWQDKESELMVKARPDILHSNMIVDLKTCADASPRAFQRAMVDGGYHIQGAMIRDAVRELEGRDIPTVINIAIEKTYPYCIGIYIIDEYALEYGAEQYRKTLLDIKSCIVHSEFPSYEIQTVSLPTWATRE